MEELPAKQIKTVEWRQERDATSLSSKSDATDCSSLLDDGVDTQCGYFRCKPDCLQHCAKPRLLLTAMCLFGLVDSFIQWGIIVVNISTWERRFQLQSTQVAWILSAQDISSGILGPVFGYLATFMHKGRLMVGGAVMMFIANCLFLVPHFAADVYELSGAYGIDTCDLKENSTALDKCADDFTDNNMERWLAVFILAQVLYGFTSMSLWTVGITYLDENSNREDTPLYLGILYTMGAVGSMLGYIGGGFFLGIYVDIGRVDMDEVTIQPQDPRWVGAWWIGFAIAAAFTIPSMFLLPCFPRQLPSAAKFKREARSQVHKGAGEKPSEQKDAKLSWSDLGTSLKLVCGNPVFMLLTCGGILEIGAVAAYSAFLPKILQFQFGLSVTMAAIVGGAILVPGAGIGQLVGGIIPKVAKLKFKGIMWMLVACQFLAVLCSAGFLTACPTPKLFGYNEDYQINSTMVFDDPLIQECNMDCNCTTQEFAPICSTSGVAFFSACHGGCTFSHPWENYYLYYNCSCLANHTMEYQAWTGLCEEQECSDFYIFISVLTVITIATFAESTGAAAATMRIVPEKQRALAFGITSTITKYLGSVPFPIIYGIIFDTSCDIWQDNCGSQGSCWIYDTHFLAVGVFVSNLVVKGFSGVLFLIGICVYKSPEEEQLTGKREEFVVNAGFGEGTYTEKGDRIVIVDPQFANEEDRALSNGVVQSRGSENNGFIVSDAAKVVEVIDDTRF